MQTGLREELRIIADLVAPGARVLDLGCGGGELLAHLKQCKGVAGYGLDNGAEEIAACIRAGVNVIEHDLNDGLTRFPDGSFDMVVMTDTLQAVRAPARLLDEMLRIGAECIVTFPNFGHWTCRLQLAARGRMPVAKHLPHSWFETPNIHLCTFADFEQLCANKGLVIAERFVVDRAFRNRALVNRFPNLLGRTAFYRLRRRDR